MKLNKFLWNIYKQSDQGKRTIELFEKGTTKEILDFAKFSAKTKKGEFDLVGLIDDIVEFIIEPEFF